MKGVKKHEQIIKNNCQKIEYCYRKKQYNWCWNVE